MDQRLNPYAPGAGAPPPELAGRDAVIEGAAVALDRIRDGRSAKSAVLIGLRGVGKTVLLNRIRINAEATGIAAVALEAPEDRSLPALIAPGLRAMLLRVDRKHEVGAAARRALRALAGFAGAMKLKFGDVEVGIEAEAEPGLADTGDLDTDLTELLEQVGAVAREHRTAVALFVDELQHVKEDQLAALIAALHRCAQRELPVTLLGAGLPQLVGQTGRAKSYAERLFEFTEIGPLEPSAARRALELPAERLQVRYDRSALDAMITDTEGYPYFLQEWGKHAWAVAESSPITFADARLATSNALAELDASFFRVRFDRLAPSEKRYLRAVAELGPGAHRSGDVAAVLRKPVTAVGPTRAKLIAKGMIYGPAHGDTAFTVPLFGGFMKRNMPTID